MGPRKFWLFWLLGFYDNLDMGQRRRMASTIKGSLDEATRAIAGFHRTMREGGGDSDMEAADAVVVLGDYLDAVQSGNLPLLTRDEIGRHCYWLWFETEHKSRAGFRFIEKMLTPTIPISSGEWLPAVVAIHEAYWADVLRDEQATKEEPTRAARTPLPDDEVPF